MARVAIVLGSTRPGRISPTVGAWVQQVLQADAQQGAVEYEILDLAEFNLPLFDEPNSPKSGKGYEFEHTKKWSAAVAGFDGFIFLVPEYNGSLPAVLKNALDFLFHEWQEKPASYVAYGWSKAASSAEHFRTVVTSLGLKLIDEHVALQLRPEVYDAEGNVADPSEAFASDATDVRAIGASLEKALV
ncbi:NADPH-dependent FMN reductase [Corynebacterium kozikiae]|uniref:NADPH-dependent FMN reductase n=1 Tax=Corynebacterium kozikiae TaxID=2968469 RepID=UPI00211C8918|nr:NAD(P)H-dependent oxidoreductase [Corynebacterium sp. 76QC2CO]MCQ9344272.1 NAD(P)H-dependent oxidoreductase [Corynebacterium sp. 76QC2CO]